MILIAPVIANVVGRTVAVRDHNINVSVIVQIAESRPAAGPDLIENCSGSGRDIHKFLSGLFQQQWLLHIAQVRLGQLNVVHHMPVGQKKVLTTVVVVIKNTHTPAGE